MRRSAADARHELLTARHRLTELRYTVPSDAPGHTRPWSSTAGEPSCGQRCARAGQARGLDDQRLPTRLSEWRKWDLHLHAPGTKLGDGYKPNDGRPDLEQFCQIVHDSDVAVIAVTDYFSLDGYFDVREKYSALYPRDNILILRIWNFGCLSQ